MCIKALRTENSQLGKHLKESVDRLQIREMDFGFLLVNIRAKDKRKPHLLLLVPHPTHSCRMEVYCRQASGGSVTHMPA